MNDRPVDIQTFDNELRELQPGHDLVLKIDRDGEVLNLKAIGEKPQVQAIYMYNLQLVGIVVLAAIIAFLFATQPMQTRLWRSATVVVIGFVLSVLLILTFTVPGIHWDIRSMTFVLRYMLVDNDPAFPRLLQQPTCGVVAVGLIVLGTMQARRSLQLADKSV